MLRTTLTTVFTTTIMMTLSCSDSGDTASQPAKVSTTLQGDPSSCPPWDSTICASWNSYGTAYAVPSIFFPNQPDPWYQPIADPKDVDKNSIAILESHMGAHDAGFNGPGNLLVECSLPYNIVDSKTQKLDYIEIKGISDDPNADSGEDNDYDDPSNIKRIPFNENMRFQNGRWENDPRPEAEKLDHHLLVYDKGTDMLYEVYQLRRQKVGHWEWGHKGLAIFALKASQPRNVAYPNYHTSADAAGFAILPGLLRSEELDGEINHALRITFSYTFQGYVSPATHFTTTGPKEGLRLPMGARLRLKDSVNETRYPIKVQRIIRCLKKYGAIVADNGTPFAISATDDCTFNNNTDLPGYRCSTGGNSFTLAADVNMTIRIRANDLEVMRLHGIKTADGRILQNSDEMKGNVQPTSLR